MNRWDETANDIFLDALEIPDEQARAKFLDEKCGQDESLKRKVGSLIVASQQAGDFLNEPIDPVEVDQATTCHIHLTAGETVGHYKLLQKIGEGGFGIVYMAEQKQPVRRKVALKIIKPGMDTREVIARFEAERQAVAMMDHPNIAKVFDAGTTDAGRPYFVMELVKGVPITQFCDENQLTTRQRLALFITVCNAVQHAHQKGVIHRDLKPSNIMVTINDGAPMAKVIDFGVAKAINCNLTNKTLFTLYGQMVGTPQYMSPEQAGVSATDLDTRSDIYSLGVLLFELLTGSPPLEEERLRRSAFAEIQRIIHEEEAPKPSTRLGTLGNNLSAIACNRKVDPAKLQRDVSGELDWIVMKSLEKDRNRRFETASGFATDVQRYLNDEPVVACPPSTGYRLRKFVRRNRTALATTAVIAVVLLLATVVSTWQAIRANNEAVVALEKEQKAQRQTKRAQKSERELRVSRERLRDQLYASNMNLASESFALGDIDRLNELVDGHRPVSHESDQRGLEWYLWWRAGHQYKGWARNTRPGQFHNLAVSPDGKIVATKDFYSGSVHVYDRASMRLICCPLHVGAKYDRLRFSPDGRFLIAADPTLTPIRIFDTKTWGNTITLDAGPTSAITFATKRPLLATDGKRQITLWDTNSWQRIDSLPAEDYSLHLDLNPAGTKLARSVGTSPSTASPLDRIELWDLAERRVIRTLNKYKVNNDEARPKAEADQNDEIAFSPDGELLAIGHRDGAVRIWTVTDLFGDGDEPSPAKTCSASNPIESLAFSPDSARIAVGTSQDNVALVWDIASTDTEPVATIQGHASGVNGVAFVGDSNTLCTSSWDGYVKTWDLSDCRPYDLISAVNSKSHAGYSLDGEFIYLDANGAIQAWDLITRQPRRILDREQTYSHIAVSADGIVLAGISTDQRRLQVWNLNDESSLFTSSLDPLRRFAESRDLPFGERGISRIVVSNDGQRVACLVPRSGDAGQALLVKSENGEIIGDAHELAYMEGWPAFSPSGLEIATQGYMDNFSRVSLIKSLASAKQHSSLQQRLLIRGGPGIEMCAAFTPNGATLAIGSANHSIRIHDVASGELIQVLKGHTEDVVSVAFSRDADRLVSSGRDGTVRIWKLGSTGYQLATTLHGRSQSIKLVAFSPTRDSLAAVNENGSIQIWRAASPQETSQNIDEALILVNDRLHTAPAQALGELDDVLQVTKDVRALTLRGRLHDLLGNWQRSVADWTAALDVDPVSHYFLQSRAKAHALGGQWKEAVADWNTLVQLTDEANGEYLLGRGQCYLHMGQPGRARADLMKALAVTASVESIEQILSLLEFAEPIVPRGSQWRYVTGLPPPTTWKLNSLDDTAWQTGWSPFGNGERDLPARTDWKGQDVWLRHTFEVDSVTNAPLAVYVRADEEVDVFVNGVAAATVSSIIEYPAYKRVYQVAECSSEARLRLGENVLAVHFRNQNWRSYVDVGLYVKADPADVEATLVEAAACAPNNGVLHTALAVRCVKQGKWKDAAVHFHDSAKLSPGRDLSWMWGALFYAYCDDLDGLHQLTADMLERFGETTSPYRAMDLAIACLVAQPTEANLGGLERLVDTALKLDPHDDKFRSAQIAKALLEYRKGNEQAAIEWAKKCQATVVLALAYARTGEVERARQKKTELEQALRNEKPFDAQVMRHGIAIEEPLSQVVLNEVRRMLAVSADEFDHTGRRAGE